MRKLIFILALVPSIGHSQEGDNVRLSNVRSSSPACEQKFTVGEDNDGVTLITFENVAVTRGRSQPFVRCRLLADMTIPVGYALSSDAIVHARVHGHFDEIGDQVAAKLKVSMFGERASDFQALRQTVELASQTGEEHDLNLHAVIPQAIACDAERTLTIGVQLEGMINYRLDRASTVYAAFDTIQFSKMTLVPVTCPPPPER